MSLSFQHRREIFKYFLIVAPRSDSIIDAFNIDAYFPLQLLSEKYFDYLNER